MKVKYLAALAAASVFGMATLTSCGPKAEETAPADGAGEVAPDATGGTAPAPATTPAPEPAK